MKRSALSTLALATATGLAGLSLVGIAYADSMSDLVAAAQKEGELTIIAVPHDWCDYGCYYYGAKCCEHHDRRVRRYFSQDILHRRQHWHHSE